MALNPDVIMVTLSSGTFFTPGGDDRGATMTVIPPAPLVWAETGDVILDGPARATSSRGPASLSVPATDQAGFVRPDGSLLIDWTYTVICAADGCTPLVRVVAIPAATEVPADELAAEGITPEDSLLLSAPSELPVDPTSFVQIITN